MYPINPADDVERQLFRPTFAISRSWAPPGTELPYPERSVFTPCRKQQRTPHRVLRPRELRKRQGVDSAFPLGEVGLRGECPCVRRHAKRKKGIARVLRVSASRLPTPTEGRNSTREIMSTVPSSIAGTCRLPSTSRPRISNRPRGNDDELIGGAAQVGVDTAVFLANPTGLRVQAQQVMLQEFPGADRI